MSTFELRAKYQLNKEQEGRKAEAGMQHAMWVLLAICLPSTLNDPTFIVCTYKKLTLDLTETTAPFQSSCLDHLIMIFSTNHLRYFFFFGII